MENARRYSDSEQQRNPQDTTEAGGGQENGTGSNFFRQVLDSLEDYAVFTTDKEGKVISWNTGAQNLLGYKEEEVLGKSTAIFFTETDIQLGNPDKELLTAITNGRAVDE